MHGRTAARTVALQQNQAAFPLSDLVALGTPIAEVVLDGTPIGTVNLQALMTQATNQEGERRRALAALEPLAEEQRIAREAAQAAQREAIATLHQVEERVREHVRAGAWVAAIDLVNGWLREHGTQAVAEHARALLRSIEDARNPQFPGEDPDVSARRCQQAAQIARILIAAGGFRYYETWSDEEGFENRVFTGGWTVVGPIALPAWQRLVDRGFPGTDRPLHEMLGRFLLCADQRLSAETIYLDETGHGHSHGVNYGQWIRGESFRPAPPGPR